MKMAVNLDWDTPKGDPEMHDAARLVSSSKVRAACDERQASTKLPACFNAPIRSTSGLSLKPQMSPKMEEDGRTKRSVFVPTRPGSDCGPSMPAQRVPSVPGSRVLEYNQLCALGIRSLHDTDERVRQGQVEKSCGYLKLQHADMPWQMRKSTWCPKWTWNAEAIWNTRSTSGAGAHFGVILQAYQ